MRPLPRKVIIPGIILVITVVIAIFFISFRAALILLHPVITNTFIAFFLVITNLILAGICIVLILRSRTYRQLHGYRSFFENSMDAILLTDSDGVILAANPAACTIFGRTEEKIRKEDTYKLVDLTDSQFNTLVTNCKDTGKAKGELTLLRQDGSKFPAELSAVVFNDAFGSEGVSIILRDITDRKKSEQIIKETEERYRKIVETAQEGIWLIDENNYTTFINKKMCEIIEYASDELMNRKIHDFMDEEGKANASEQIARRRQGLNENHDSRFITKSGKYLWTNLSTNPIFDNDGKYKGALAMITDITERKISEEKLQKSFEELQKASQHQSAILNALPALVALLDEEGNIIALNEAWIKLALRINSKDENYFIGGNYLRLAENTKGEGAHYGMKIANGTRAVITGQQPRFSLEYYYTNQSAQKRWFRVEITPLSDKTHAGVVVMHIDITDRKTDEEKIIQNNERYRLVTSTTNDAIWDWNIERDELYLNEGYQKLFGHDVSSQKPSVDIWKSRIHPEDQENILKSVLQKIKNPEPTYWEGEYRYLKNDGTYAFIHDRADILLNKNNEPIRMIGAMQDITRRKLAELERDKTTIDLIQRNTALEQFAYIVSHNLRAPVANIIGCTDVLSELQLDEQSKKEIMQGLAVSAKKLDKVIWDLNEILQVKHDINEKKELICFSELVEDIKISIEGLIQKEEVTIIAHFDIIDEFPFIRTYLYSIFYNLISNSIKYRQQNIPPVIEISSRKLTDNKLELTFKDNGIGIDLATKGEQVFGLYKRFHAHIEGKGMGLFMVKTQVEVMGGSIGIQSEVDKGTIFTILFDT